MKSWPHAQFIGKLLRHGLSHLFEFGVFLQSLDVNQAFTDSSMIPAPNFWTIDFASSCVSPKTFAHGESAPQLGNICGLEDFLEWPIGTRRRQVREHFRHEAL